MNMWRPDPKHVWLWSLIVCIRIGTCAAAQEPDAAEQPGHVEHPGRALALPDVDAEVLTVFSAVRERVRADGEPIGIIDWGAAEVVASGRAEQQGDDPQSILAAKRAAGVAAMRNAASMAAAIRLGVAGPIHKVDNQRTEFTAFIKGFKNTDPVAVEENGTTFWECKVRLPMHGLQSIAARFRKLHSAAQGRVLRQVRRVKLVEVGLRARQNVQGDLLVIDARGTAFKPAIFPVFQAPDGAVLVDAEQLPNLAVEQGLCVYGTTKLTAEELQAHLGEHGRVVVLKEALALAGEHDAQAAVLAAVIAQANATTQPADAPAEGKKRRRRVVQADKAEGSENAQLVIAAEDARKMQEDEETAALIKSGQVLVVVDAAAAGQEGRIDLPAFMLDRAVAEANKPRIASP